MQSLIVMFAFQSACRLVQSKEIPMQPDDAMRVFASDSYAKAVLQGNVPTKLTLKIVRSDSKIVHIKFYAFM